MPLDYYPYQIVGGEFLAARRLALLADDMGVGKSATTVCAADMIKARSILVICPASLRINWQREFAKFSRRDMSVLVVRSAKDFADAFLYDVVVVSYDLAAGSLYRAIMALRWDLLVLDEAHALKGIATKRSKAIYGKALDCKTGIASRCERIWALTGTPAPSHMGELWTICRALFPSVITNNGRILDYWSWVRRTCHVYDGNFGPVINGSRPERVPEVKAALQPFMLRRLKKEVLPQLPNIRYEDCPLDAVEFRSALRDMENGPEGKALRSALDGGTDAMEALEQIAPHLASLRKLLGKAKVKPVIDLLKTEFDGGLDKIVLFAQHRDVIDGLVEGLKDFGPVAVHGGVSANNRQIAIDAFQTDPNTRVIVCQLQAASTGLTLTAACNLLYVETDWVPAVMEQSAMRVHRLGQTRDVRIRFASVAGSLDERIQFVVRKKIEVLTQLFG